MSKNTGIPFEEMVFKIIENQVKSNEFLLSNPNVKVHRKAKYYSRDREAEIECEISVEKYLGNSSEGVKPILRWKLRRKKMWQRKRGYLLIVIKSRI